jgi:hypothetical protein
MVNDRFKGGREEGHRDGEEMLGERDNPFILQASVIVFLKFCCFFYSILSSHG